MTAAKVELVGDVAIDLPAGPSEGLVLADATADPRPSPRTWSPRPSTAWTPPPSSSRPTRRSPTRSRPRSAAACRRPRAARSSPARSPTTAGSCSSRTSPPAIAFVDGYGPEHLSIDVADVEAAVARDPQRGLDLRRAAGRPESAGDYASGANHVLPTGGLARACGPLAVETFGKFIQVQRITREGLARLRPTIRTLAEAEGLLAHRDAVEARFDDAATDEPAR